MEGFYILGSENRELAGNMKKEMVEQKKRSIGSAVRNSLSDITNSQQHGPKLPSNKDDNRSPNSTNDHIEKLHKENMMLLKLLADRNKIIELTGAELAKMRLNLQKVQQQNWQLAQANSHMLAELNLGKDKLKALQHELGCKIALLLAKDLELREKMKKKPHKKTQIDERGKDTKGEEAFSETDAENKIPIVYKKRQSRSLSQGSGSVKQQLATNERGKDSSCQQKESVHIKTELEETEERVDNKRVCLRRQSARFKSKQQEPAEDLFELEDAKFPVRPLEDDHIHIKGNEAIPSTSKDDQEETAVSNSMCETPAPRRSFIGRPMRKATEKVQSYKERPVNIKLRRAE